MTSDASPPPGALGRNPFVGPRPFQSGERLFGRLKETRELYYLLSAERIVWLHSPSGAGKTSLIWASLVPRLKRDGFRVCPPIRVNLDLPQMGQGAADPGRAAGNRFLTSLMLSLEEGLPRDQRRPVAAVAAETLGDYLAGRLALERETGAAGILLVFDQFEEILTVDPLDTEAKRVFFQTIGEALRDPSLWALFALREEYLAQMEPYVDLIPTRWSNTSRLELLGREAVEEVLTRTAGLGGRTFSENAAESLFADLARTKVQRPDGSFAEETGRFVEPVQLQVVCRRLWDAMPVDDLSIDAEDLTRFGDVGEALAGYYGDAVARIAAGDLGLERRIREWFGTRLITPGGIRAQVLRGADDSDGCENAVIEEILDTHLVRGEKRAGATWYELAHDRLIQPVRESNQDWYEDHLEPFQRQTTLWVKQGRPASGGNELLRGSMYKDAVRFARLNPALVSADEAKLIAISRNARQIRHWTRGTAAALVVVSIAFAYYAWQLKTQAEEKEREAWYQVAIGHWKDAENERARAPLKALHHYTQAAARFAWSGNRPEAANALLARRFLLDEPILVTAIDQGSSIAGARWSPDGTAVLTWGDREDGGADARLWSAATGEPLLPPLRQDSPIAGAAFSRDGSRIQTWAADGDARLWDASNGYDITPGGDHPTVANPAGQAPANGDGDVDAPGTEDAAPDTRRRPFNRVLGALPNPDRSRFLTWGFDGSARVWQRDTGRSAALPLAQRQTGLGAQLSDDGASILVWGQDGGLRVLDTTTGMPLSRPIVHAGIQGALYRPGIRRVLSWGRDGAARLWDAKTGLPASEPLAHDDAVTGARFSADQSRVLSWSIDDSARLWDTETGRALMLPMRHQGAVREAAFAPVADAGRQPILTWGEDGSARVWRPPRAAPESPRPLPDPEATEPPGDGSAAATAEPPGAELQPRPSDLPPALMAALRRERQRGGMRYSADRARILAWGGDRGGGSAQLWDVSTAEALTPPLKHRRAVRGAVLNSDGSRILTWSDDGTARLWDSRSGDALTPPLRLGQRVVRAALDATETRILLSGDDGQTRTFDIAVDRDWPFTALVLQTEVETGTRLLPNGEVRALTPVEWGRLRHCDYDRVRRDLGRLDDDAWARSQRLCDRVPEGTQAGGGAKAR
jgi:WD40 repeat protein